MMGVFRADRLTRITCRRSRSRRTRRLTSRLTPSAFSLLFGSRKSRPLGLPTGIEQLDQDESCRRASGFGRHFDPPPRHLHERLGLLAFGRCRPLFDLGNPSRRLPLCGVGGGLLGQPRQHPVPDLDAAWIGIAVRVTNYLRAPSMTLKF